MTQVGAFCWLMLISLRILSRRQHRLQILSRLPHPNKIKSQVASPFNRNIYRLELKVGIVIAIIHLVGVVHRQLANQKSGKKEITSFEEVFRRLKGSEGAQSC